MLVAVLDKQSVALLNAGRYRAGQVDTWHISLHRPGVEDWHTVLALKLNPRHLEQALVAAEPRVQQHKVRLMHNRPGLAELAIRGWHQDDMRWRDLHWDRLR